MGFVGCIAGVRSLEAGPGVSRAEWALDPERALVKLDCASVTSVLDLARSTMEMSGLDFLGSGIVRRVTLRLNGA